MDTRLESINGVVENVVYHNENNDYTVLEVNYEGELITAVGSIPAVYEGETVSLGGRWTYHKEFGRQFSFDSFEKSLPEDVDGILQYLSSSTVKGIGPITALKIVNKFGKDSFDVIENHPEWLTDISGITMKKAVIISESFKKQTGVREVMMFCKDYFASSEVTRIYKLLGTDAVRTISDNPYILCEGDYAIPFDKVDKMAMDLDFSPISPIRILAACKYVIAKKAFLNGHTAFPCKSLIHEVSQVISEDSGLIEKELNTFVEESFLRKETVLGTDFIMTNEVYESEQFIVRRLFEIERDGAKFSYTEIEGILQKLEITLGIEYVERQKAAIYAALTSNVMLLTGGPGTGKTTVIKALVSIFDSFGMKTVLAAPTGRAAKRMSEATSYKAKTVHRMLEMEKSETEKIRFARNGRNPLDEKVVIIDEASMIDLQLMDALLAALPRGAKLVLIGDVDQLPSVGAGNVFADMINSGKFNTVRLTEIFRQAKESLIITNAHRINSGVAPILNATDNDFFFVRRENESDIPSAISALITERLPRTYGNSIKDKIQVISPSKRGHGGIVALNQELQSKLNPKTSVKKEKQSHGVTFREGDRVMQIVNNYDVEWEKDNEVGNGIFNGDIGVIEVINHSKNEMIINFDERIVNYGFDFLDDLELAYAITVHKSQGSEYPVIIIPMYNCPQMLMTRNLLYTAVTRARQMVILVGKYAIASKMVENNRELKRFTTLEQRISNY